MSEESLFRIALAPVALFIWARYVTWPFFIVGVSVLIFRKIKPEPRWVAVLVVMQRSMIGCAALLCISLIVSYFMIPAHDKQLGVFWYGALLGSLPVLLPSAIALLLGAIPTTGRERQAARLNEAG